MIRSDIDAVIAVTRSARHPMAHVFIATSPIHREFKLKMSKDDIIKKITEDITYTKSKIKDIVFSPEDATRTEPGFLVRSVQATIDAGATIINIPDTVVYATPDEYGAIFKNSKNNIIKFDDIIWSTHAHNDLGMATANTLAKNTKKFDISLAVIGDDKQGIVHIVCPERGLTQPVKIIVCGDSHTGTHGAFGAIA